MKFRPFEEVFEIPLRNGLTKPKSVRGEGFKMINMGELFGFSRMKNISMDRVPLTDKEIESSMVEPGDLLFARQLLIREGAGQCAIFLGDEEKVCFESHLIRCRLNKKIANPLFYYYYFLSRLGKIAINAIIEQGAGAAGIRGSDLAKVLVPDLKKDDQDRISDNFDQLDSKIELNHQINQTLEEMAQAIFKSWFVDFDPVKAKIEAKAGGQDPERAAMCAISGKTAAELDLLLPDQLAQLRTTAALFPDELTDSELGLIPDGWEWSTIGKEVDVVGGGTPSTKVADFWDEGVYNWTTPKDLSGVQEKILLDTERKITKPGLEKISSGLLPVNTVLLSSRAPVGYLALAKRPVAINQGYIAMKCTDSLPPEYVLQWAESVMDEIKQRASGTTFAEISKKNFREIPVLVPASTVVREFQKLASGIYEKIKESMEESKYLAEIRDSLLPKLLSGEIELTGVGDERS